jgi:signal transduction histidine kinase
VTEKDLSSIIVVMQRVLMLLRKLTNIGVSPSLSVELNQRIILTNQVVLTLCIASSPFYVIFNLAGAQLLGNTVVFSVFTWAFSIYLNHKKKYTASRLLLILFSCICVIFYATSLGRESGVHFISFSFFAISMVLVDSKSATFRKIFLSLPVATFILIELLSFELFPRVVLDPFYIKICYLAISFMTFFIMYLAIFYINENHSKRLKNVNLELKEALYKARKQKNILEKVSQQAAFTTLSMGIAHEIRNPMFNLLARAEIIEEDPENAKEVVKFSEMIKRNISRILNITNTMLKYGNPVVSEKGAISIKGILNEIIEVTKGKCQQHQIKIVTNFEEMVPICADSSRIYRALINIVMNAIESMETGGGTLTITAKDAVFVNSDNIETEGVSIEIKDTGVGVNPEMKDTIFDPFFTTKYKNSGLGLAVALKSIHSHNGLISLNSELGEGTTFTIHLPKDGH